MKCRFHTVFLLACCVPNLALAGQLGYYRYPALHKDTLVFVSEGDLWKVSSKGGTATRLTTHAGEEGRPAISPDGKLIAFVASYEGPTEVYVMPVEGGLPRRLTWDNARISHVGWTPDGRVLISTNVFATYPSQQLVIIDPRQGKDAKPLVRVPLAQAADGCLDDAGRSIFFTRLPFQGSQTRGYKGGTAQNLWRYDQDDVEAVALTADYPGTSKNPMFWKDRLYFLSDRDGYMNIWSMRPSGRDLKQHTKHKGWEAASASLWEGHIVYQLGADIHLYDCATDRDSAVAIQIDSDFDQTREKWIKNPMEYLSSFHLSPDGGKVVLTARGQVFVAPARTGRFVEVARKPGVRYRDARFLPDGKSIVAFSDESGENEIWKLPANGAGAHEQLTRDGDVLRWDLIPSPDGKYLAHYDKNRRLFIFDIAKKENRKIEESGVDDFEHLQWSPDSKWLAYVITERNLFRRIKLYSVADNEGVFATTDRYDSYSPAWSPDGKWLSFLSDRNLQSSVSSPWGTYQPEPYLAKKTRIYQLALVDGLRFPFLPPDELVSEKKDPPRKDDKKDPVEKKEPSVRIQRDNLARRLHEVPVPAGNYRDLTVNEKGLFYISSTPGEGPANLVAVAISSENVEVKTVVADVRSYEMSADGRKIIVRKGDALSIIDAAPVPADLAKKDVNLANWTMSIIPREEWKQMFADAWRLERDYFYDRAMHGVDWPAMRKKYQPLVDRIGSRAELSDLIAKMVSELGALHIFVNGGDMRKGDDNIGPASLGALLTRDENAGGYRVDHIYMTDPDEPNLTAPLARPEVNVRVGDVIEKINGESVLSVPAIGMLLRRKEGQQVLLTVKSGKGKSRDVIVKPVAAVRASDLRYHDWEQSRRQEVEEKGRGEIGYVHLRAMGGANFTEWARNFYPVFTRQGLIIDVRHNRGGNIDSWIISRLLRKSTLFWNQRVGGTWQWNMQYAFRGHIVVLCDGDTSSDGETFCEQIRRHKLGTVIGTRTWGGGIWLTSSNFLVDRGIATAAEFGVFDPKGSWVIEGHGFDPDIVVDNLPHATFKGKDAQLEAALRHLQQQIRDKPVELPVAPKGPRVFEREKQ